MTGRRLGRVGPVAALALVALLVGCSKPDTSPMPNSVSPPADAATEDLSPPIPGRWSGFRAKCPVLDSAAARTFGVTGEGRPTSDYHDGNGLTADCEWGATDGKGTAVHARVSVYPVQRAADAHWKVIAGAGFPRVSGLGDEAFNAMEGWGPSVVLRVRSANAVAVIRVTVPAVGQDDLVDRLREVEPTAREIARDVIADLV